MREIKFRGKRIDNKEWVYGYLFLTTADTISKEKLTPCIQVVDGTKYTTYKVHPESVGQFIGLEDKNGKEIYEGDVIKGMDDDLEVWGEYTVRYDGTIAMYTLINKKVNNPILCFNGTLAHVEIIGNMPEETNDEKHTK